MNSIIYLLWYRLNGHDFLIRQQTFTIFFPCVHLDPLLIEWEIKFTIFVYISNRLSLEIYFPIRNKILDIIRTEIKSFLNKKNWLSLWKILLLELFLFCKFQLSKKAQIHRWKREQMRSSPNSNPLTNTHTNPQLWSTSI